MRLQRDFLHMHLGTLGNNFKKHHKATLVHTRFGSSGGAGSWDGNIAISPSGTPGCIGSVAEWQEPASKSSGRQVQGHHLLAWGGNLLDHSGLQLLRHSIEHTVSNQRKSAKATRKAREKLLCPPTVTQMRHWVNKSTSLIFISL